MDFYGLRVSVITQFDGPLIEFDDGLQPSLNVIGGGIAANGDITIKIGDVHQDHEQERRQR